MPQFEKDDEILAFGDSAPKKEFEPVDEDDYELEIVSFEYRKTATTGTQQLNFKLRIREDVEQKNRGRILFYPITKREGDRAFNFYRINNLIVATKNCPGYREKFGKEFDEVLQYLIGRQFRAHVIVEEYVNAEGTPVRRNRIDDNSFEVSKWNSAAKKPAAPVAENTDRLEISPDDLPF